MRSSLLLSLLLASSSHGDYNDPFYTDPNYINYDDLETLCWGAPIQLKVMVPTLPVAVMTPATLDPRMTGYMGMAAPGRAWPWRATLWFYTHRSPRNCPCSSSAPSKGK